jgi:hypothetical protein
MRLRGLIIASQCHGIKVVDTKLAQYHETHLPLFGTSRTNQAGPTRWSRAMWHVIICITL